MKNKCILFFLLILILSFVSVELLNAEVKLPSIFDDNMVLQQQSKAAIWGWAKSGSTISVVPSWDGKNYTVLTDASGKWKLYIETPAAGGPYEITISDGKPIKLKNVLIGEVWLCSGQSNMEMPMKGFMSQPVLGSNEDILKSKNNNIRFISVPRSPKTIPQEDFNGQWKEADPETVSDFSAVAYYFGKLLNEMLDVPVGLIDVSYGGSCIQTWMSKNTAIPFEGKNIPEPEDSIGINNRTPTALFNGMLYPVIGYGIKGCIWYQGETNSGEAEKYEELFITMVKEWRSLWETGDFPFYYAQIAPYDYSPDITDDSGIDIFSAYLREAQLKAMDKIPECGMAVLMDTGEEKCIHPSNKEAAGNRLAYWALAKTYDIKGFGYASPVVDSIFIKENEVTITFLNVPNGLTSFGKELSCFEIAGADKKFYPAKAVISRDIVSVSSKDVKNPVSVRYAFRDFVIGDLFSTEGLPVSSFRSDNW